MPEFDLDDPRLDLITEPVRAAVAELLGTVQHEMPAGTALAAIGIAWQAVMVALAAREAELETAEILADPLTMGRLGESQAELAGNADAVTAIVAATGGTAFYSADGEAMVLADHRGPERNGRLISVCGHGSPVFAPLGAWLPGYPE